MAEVQQPYSIDAERAVLGSMMLSDEALIVGITSLIETDFYEPKHQVIFAMIQNLYKNQQPVDIATVSDELMNAQKLDTIGGTMVLSEMCDSVLTPSNITSYVRLVKDKANLRILLNKMNGFIQQWNEGQFTDIGDYFTKVENEITKITKNRHVAEIQTSAEVAQRVNERIAQHSMLKGGLTGVPSGFTYLDKITNGFQNSDLLILAARPSVGKTALSLNLAINAMKNSPKGVSVAFFSLEMSAEQLVQRLLSTESHIPLDHLRSMNFGEKELYMLDLAVKKISNYQLFIDDTPSAKLADIQAKARKLKSQHDNLSFIVIDYIQLAVGTSNPKGDNRQQEVSEISRGLKAMARELKVPVLALSQLSRGIEARKGADKEPRLSDLRESGAIEQDADVVMFLGPHIDDEGNVTETISVANEADNAPTVVDLNIRKHRNGPIGKVMLTFVKQYGIFNTYYEDSKGPHGPEKGK